MDFPTLDTRYSMNFVNAFIYSHETMWVIKNWNGKRRVNTLRCIYFAKIIIIVETTMKCNILMIVKINYLKKCYLNMR